MNYKNEDITKRAEESLLWKSVETQRGNALPYLLERYLLLENWKYLDRLEIPEASTPHDLQYLHLLLADTVTVLLSQEERIRNLEAHILANAEVSHGAKNQ
jgi:hypothetical protein